MPQEELKKTIAEAKEKLQRLLLIDLAADMEKIAPNWEKIFIQGGSNYWNDGEPTRPCLFGYGSSIGQEDEEPFHHHIFNVLNHIDWCEAFTSYGGNFEIDWNRGQNPEIKTIEEISNA